MAGPRAYWKGYLKLSLVTCPVALYSAVSDAAKTKFNQLNSATGNKIKQQLVDSVTGEVVERENVVKGYEHAKDSYLKVEEADFEGIKLESTHTIEIVSFVPKAEVDDRYLDGHYFMGPSDKIGVDAFAVIREAMNAKGVVGLGRVVMNKRERVVMLMPSEKGLMASTLRYDYEVRNKATVFDDIPDVKVAPEMLQMAGQMVESMKGSFDPTAFEDRYETALQEMIKQKLSGAPAPAAPKAEQKSVVDLMAALRASVEGAGAAKPAAEPKADKTDKATKAAAAAEIVPIAPGNDAEVKTPDRRRKKGAASKTIPTSEADVADAADEQPAAKVGAGF